MPAKPWTWYWIPLRLFSSRNGRYSNICLVEYTATRLTWNIICKSPGPTEPASTKAPFLWVYRDSLPSPSWSWNPDTNSSNMLKIPPLFPVDAHLTLSQIHTTLMAISLDVPTIGNTDFDHSVKVLACWSPNVNSTFLRSEFVKIWRDNTLLPLNTLLSPNLSHNNFSMHR